MMRSEDEDPVSIPPSREEEGGGEALVPVRGEVRALVQGARVDGKLQLRGTRWEREGRGIERERRGRERHALGEREKWGGRGTRWERDRKIETTGKERERSTHSILLFILSGKTKEN